MSDRKHVPSSTISLVIDALATYRLTKLVIDDYITEPLRDKVYERFGQPDQSKIAYLISCPWCVSIYAGIGVSACRRISPKAWRMVAEGLAFSAISGLLAERT